MTDIRQVYLGPNETDPIKQNSAIRQLLECVGDGLREIIIYPTGDTSGATDYKNITKALATAVSRNVPYVRLWSGTFYVNNTILISTDNTGLVGAGATGNAFTQIQVIGNFAGVKVSRTGAQVQNWYLANFQVFFFSGSSNVGVQIDSSASGILEDINVVNGTSSGGIGLLVRADQSATINNCYFLNYTSFSGANASSAIGLILDSSVNGQNANFNTFVLPGIQLNRADQIGIQLGACDSNDFISAQVYGGTSVAATAVNFNYSGAPAIAGGWPSSNTFWHFDGGFNITSGSSAYTNTGTVVANHPNSFFRFSTENSATPPYTLKGVDVIRVEDTYVHSTPTPTPQGGAFTTVSCDLYTKVVGKTVYFYTTVTVTTLGTATGYIAVPLPFATPRVTFTTCAGINNTSGAVCAGSVSSAVNSVLIIPHVALAANSYGASGFYEQAP